MTTICYYVSDYGYGHATRSIAVIRRLLRHSRYRGDLKLLVRSGKALPFLQQSLAEEVMTNRVECIPFASELGYVLIEGSIQIDLDRMHSQYERYIGDFPRIVENERTFLLEHKVDLVVSDISPIPFESAYLAGIPSVGISNFTWYTAYRRMLDSSLLAVLHGAYSKMDDFIQLAGADEPDWCSPRTKRIGFYCRAAEPEEVCRIRQELNSDGERKIVLFAIGMGISVHDLKEMNLWEEKDLHFVVSSNMDITGRNVSKIPIDYTESQNYAAAADLIITKPGWGTLSEGIQYHKPVLILERDGFQEDANTLNSIRGLDGIRFLDWEQLKKLKISSSYVEFLKAEASWGRKKTEDSLGLVVERMDHLLSGLRRKIVLIRSEAK